MRILPDALRIYLFALGAGLSALRKGLYVEGFKLLMTPVGYWRLLPFAFTYQAFREHRNPRVLDVSSPKLLGQFLASRTSGRVVATDLDDVKIFSRWKPLADARSLGNYDVEYQDARRLSYPDDFFDFVYSISVIEHIPGDGDREALAEFRRVLKPGGTLVVEVPYRREREEVFMPYDSKGLPTDIPQFYERHYDRGLLEDRLRIEGLTVEKSLILGERVLLDPWMSGRARLPRLLRTALLPLEPWLAAANCWARGDDGAGFPGSALKVYRKDRPAAPVAAA